MKLYLIDGNSYIYRAFYAIRSLTNSKGFPTNAIYGFTNMLLKIMRQKKPDGIIVSFDTSAPTERHRLFKDYKAHRPEMPEELVQQLPYIRKITSALNIKIFEVPGYEADDLLCTIAKKAEKEGADVFIVTADKDMLQTVSGGIRVYDPVKDRLLDEAYVREKFGIEPSRMPEFTALTGDAADNIPGIKGIGEKTAKELLSSFKDLEDLLEHPERIKKEKLRALISENAEIAKLSRRLATINSSVPIDVNIHEFTMREPDWAALLPLFREFEFGSLMKLVPSVKLERHYETLFSVGRLRELLLSIGSAFAFDIEAAGTDPLKDTIAGIALSIEKDKACYIPLGHLYSGAPEQMGRKEALELLSGKFGDAGLPKIGHNLKYDVAMLKQCGIEVKGILYDTMLASYLLRPDKPAHSLGDSAFEYLSYRKKTFQDVLGKRKSFSEIPVEDAAPYAVEDAVLAFELKEILFDKLKTEGLDRLYFDMEMPLISVLIEMEEAGFKVDAGRLNDMSGELAGELEAIQSRVYFLAGEEFNINSPRQLSRILFHTLGLKPGKKKKTGYSTEMSVLEDLAAEHELPQEILNYRSLSKLKSTYTDVLPRMLHPKTGRIHTSFNQTATSTGRLSSSEPNLQNIPIKGDWGRRIREAFIAEPGNLILSADYSQIELRVLAHLSSDQGMIDSFMSDVDIHTRTASEIFGIGTDKVTAEMRRIAKTVNFGVVYGMTPFGLSEALNINAGEARKYITGYFERHAGVKAYIAQTLKDAETKGYVVTMFGRKRAVPELHSGNAGTRSFGERLAVNSPIQGTAADIIKIAMINAHAALKGEGLEGRLILQVHDELVFEVPERELDKVAALVKDKMEGAVNICIPLKTDIGYGKNWAEAHA